MPREKTQTVRVSQLERLTGQDWLDRARAAKYSVSLLAKLCNISPRQLRRYFVKRFSFSPEALLAELRRWDAAKVLCSGAGIKEAAFLSNFSDTANFCRWFKHHHRISPSEFCLRHQRWESGQKIQWQSWFGSTHGLKVVFPWERVEKSLCLALTYPQMSPNDNKCPLMTVKWR